MTKHGAATVAALFCVIVACRAEPQSAPPILLKSFVLSDVQGLFGGQSIWARQDGTAFVQVAGRAPAGQVGLWEKRYRTTLSAAQWAEVERLVGMHHFLTIKMPTRPGVPDEAHPTIVLLTRAGATIKVGKWANDKHPDFDPVYAYILSLCRAGGELLREGNFEWEWRPDGFEQP